MALDATTNAHPDSDRPLKIAVLAGGVGPEKPISLQSGKAITAALQNANFNARMAHITPQNLTVLDDQTIDLFFLALHGEFGEDGTIQSILDEKGLTYTASDAEASRIAFDKTAAKQAFAQAGVFVPRAVPYCPRQDRSRLLEKLTGLSEKFVVKPAKQGSSVGISICNTPQEALETAAATYDRYGECIIEQFLPGTELTVGILSAEPLPIIEIRPETGFYDYQAKYIDETTGFLFDTINDPKLVERIKTDALKCFNALGCRHFARVDFILTDRQRPYALEVNTIPGFTDHSLLPMAAKRAGLKMPQLCSRIANMAVNHVQPRHPEPNKIT